MTILGLILLGFVGFSAIFTLFVFWFGDKGTFLNVTSSAPGGTPAPSSPITTFPTTLSGTGTLGGTIDVTLSTLGLVFVDGGMIAALLLVVLLFLAPHMLISKCLACNICNACEAPQPSCGGCAA